ncbi:putative two-domain glycosyltransferase [Vibrio variabilis]|uniref:Two-domain glycosyltransferase n=1 Tax=Vibrio variabilis TaxID=990271 RepID=A0ABQ0J5X9_9VIBR|nr:putative two-domain glycosyltransferase [Vibrio variabilis]
MTSQAKSNQARASIAAIIITKNEEASLEECLQSVAWVDEIIIVDSGSTDGTQKIAEKYGAKFFVNSEWPGFGKQKQLAQSYTDCDWVLALDADERIDDVLQQEIQTMLIAPPKNAVFSLNELTWVFGRFLRHSLVLSSCSLISKLADTIQRQPSARVGYYPDGVDTKRLKVIFFTIPTKIWNIT